MRASSESGQTLCKWSWLASSHAALCKLHAAAPRGVQTDNEHVVRHAGWLGRVGGVIIYSNVRHTSPLKPFESVPNRFHKKSIEPVCNRFRVSVNVFEKNRLLAAAAVIVLPAATPPTGVGGSTPPPRAHLQRPATKRNPNKKDETILFRKRQTWSITMTHKHDRAMANHHYGRCQVKFRKTFAKNQNLRTASPKQLNFV